MNYVCQNCGDITTGDRGWEPWDCVICGGDVVPEDQSDVTPNDELRELHGELLNAAQGAGSSGNVEAANVLESFAEDLEEIIEE